MNPCKGCLYNYFPDMEKCHECPSYLEGKADADMEANYMAREDARRSEDEEDR